VHLREALSNFPKRSDRLIQDQARRPVRAIGSASSDGVRALVQPIRKLRPPEVEALVADYATGRCLTALGEKYGIHRQTAKAHLERAGVEIRSELPALDERQVGEAVALYATGLGLKPVATKLGVSANTVKRALLARGVRLKPRGYSGPRP